MKKVLKYGTGDELPVSARYLYSCKNGFLNKSNDYKYVWHYFLVDVIE